MKKSLALAIAAAMSLSVAGTALANNPFSDVPQGHWAYDAVAQLERDGLITGYGDGTYRGDRAMSRYEMATVVAQLDDANGENAELINRLRSEFATELYNLGVRVDKLEKNASSIKFSGDSRIRYQSGGGVPPVMSLKDHPFQTKSHRFQQRIGINMTADINEKVKFLGRIHYEHTSNRTSSGLASPNAKPQTPYSFSHDVWMPRAEIQWNNGTFQGRFGRIAPKIGQGLLGGGPAPGDGVLLGYKTDKWNIFAGVLDWRPSDPVHGDNSSGAGSTSRNVTVANIGYKFSDKFELTAAYSNGHRSEKTKFIRAGGTNNPSDPIIGVDGEQGYPFDLWSVGFNAKLGKDWVWTAEYVKNESEEARSWRTGEKEDTGYWTRLQYKNANMSKPGSYSVFVEYLNLEAYAIDTDAGFSNFELTPGNGYMVNPGWAIPNGIGATQGYYTYAAGAKGYGIGITYVVKKNINMQFIFHDLEPTDKSVGTNSYEKVYQFSTNFRF